MRAGLCVQSVWAGGAGRPCRNWNGQALCGGVHREGIYGNARKGERKRERVSGNQEEKVTMSTRNLEAVGEESDVIVGVLQDHEKEMQWQWKSEHEV